MQESPHSLLTDQYNEVTAVGVSALGCFMTAIGFLMFKMANTDFEKQPNGWGVFFKTKWILGLISLGIGQLLNTRKLD
jgi:hypothetical protein